MTCRDSVTQRRTDVYLASCAHDTFNYTEFTTNEYWQLNNHLPFSNMILWFINSFSTKLISLLIPYILVLPNFHPHYFMICWIMMFNLCTYVLPKLLICNKHTCSYITCHSYVPLFMNIQWWINDSSVCWISVCVHASARVCVCFQSHIIG